MWDGNKCFFCENVCGLVFLFCEKIYIVFMLEDKENEVKNISYIRIEFNWFI